MKTIRILLCVALAVFSLILIQRERVEATGDAPSSPSQPAARTDEVDQIVGHLLGRAPLSGEEFVRADVNQDGKVDVSDIHSIPPDWGESTTITLPGNVPLILLPIPSGSFQMGSPSTELDRWQFEGPVHTVNIAHPFHMGKYEVTKGQWQAMMGTTPWSDRDYVLNDPDSPAVYVSWNDAKAFVAALNTHIANTAQGPLTVRLPSEAEWEYAARAGTTTRFYWGDDHTYSQIDAYAWYDLNSKNMNERYARRVGLKLPNAWGLYDMSGNVFEWCGDYWHSSYTGAPTDGSAWLDLSTSHRVLRGGSWQTYGKFCRSADRFNYPLTYTGDYYGFRLVAVRP
jgi:formylglycine-generating enzyme required for sulfatase activity